MAMRQARTSTQLTCRCRGGFAGTFVKLLRGLCHCQALVLRSVPMVAGIWWERSCRSRVPAPCASDSASGASDSSPGGF
eukprot:8952388-Prorocentrum_lima.AAC.1